LPGVSGQFGHTFGNSLKLTFETVTVTLLISLPAGFAFSRLKIPARAGCCSARSWGP
jgi:ABC-type maltose transport system permease subunit